MSNYEIHQIHGALTAEGLKDALARFYQRHQHLPISINTHHTQLQRTRVLLKELELEIPTYQNGGALQHELWMNTTDPQEIPA